MSNASAKKVFIQIESAEEQEAHIKHQRKTLKVLQGDATDKENLAGRPLFDKLSRLKSSVDVTLASNDSTKNKKIDLHNVETQTSPQKKTDPVTSITAADLTSKEPPSEYYFERLAEKRREALEQTLAENERLHMRIEGLEEELNTSRQMLDEARNLVEVLTEMLNESESEGTEEDVQAVERVGGEITTGMISIPVQDPDKDDNTAADEKNKATTHEQDDNSS